MKTALIAALIAAAPAEQPQPPCLTPAQVENMTLFALPPLLEAAATACAPELPADAYLLNGGRALARSLAADSAGRWASANSILTMMARDKFPAGLSEATARGLLHDMTLNGLSVEGGRAQCGRINRAADLLSPLPPANLAGLLVLAIEVGSENDRGDKAKSKSKAKSGTGVPKPPLICPATRP
ncbi:MAG TPA: hypothetical protein VFQ67_12150 [Allosphingosinicella sp.]|nr:hypothetical protein [Allosphingosinicella sp.]